MRLVVPLLALAVLSVPVAGAPSLAVQLRGAKGEPVADAVASLTPLDAPIPPAANLQPVEVAQEDQEYQPYVTAIRVGTTVEFPNKDKVQHHLYSLSKPKRFEKPLYGSGRKEAVVFDQPGVVTLGCNIHDWMLAYIVVLETPWFAKSDKEGTCSLGGIPPGRYRLQVWHPRLASVLEREVTVTDGAATEAIDLKLKPDRRIRRAPDGRSGGY